MKDQLETGRIRERRGKKKTAWGGNQPVGQGDWVWLRTTEKLGHGEKDGTG